MRSLLFVPADSERKLAKSPTSGADALILDLEDSVTLENKPAARSNALAFLKDRTGAGLQKTPDARKPAVYVRINDLGSDLWRADLEAVAGAGPDGVILPKPRSGADVKELGGVLNSLERNHGLEPGGVAIIAIVTETAESLLNMASYIGSSPRLEGLCWGGEDLAAVLGARSNRGDRGRYTPPYQLARSLCLVTAAAAGAEAIDAVYTNFRDEDGLRAEAEEAARDGFTGKLAIHPAQVAIINEVFTPSAADIEAAERIVAAFDGKGGAGAISIDGQMIDRPHLVQAHKLLARAALASQGRETAKPKS